MSDIEAKPLNEWFSVTFDDDRITISCAPPGGEAWEQQVDWTDIIRVCFQLGDMYSSDDIYLFTKHRPESYVIPTEAAGGSDLWGEIVGRELFDPDLAIKIMTADEGLFCWPEIESQ